MLATVMSAVALTACGIDPADFRIPEGVLPPVVLATPKQIADGDVYANRYIVAFRTPAGAGGRSFKSFQAEHRFHFSLLADTFMSDPGIRDIHFITTLDMANPGDEQTIEDISPPQALQLAWSGEPAAAVEGAITVVEFTDNDTAARILTEWEEQGDIWFAEPDHLSYLDNTTIQNPVSTQMVEDYKVGAPWHLREIKLPEAMEKFAAKTFDDGVQIPVVAVLDSGVDTQHPNLAQNIWTNPAPGQSGCVGDEFGCDTTVFVRGKIGVGTPYPYLTSGPGQPCPKAADKNTCEHGTHVAGLVAGKLDGPAGGACPVCQIMPIKIIAAIGGKGAASDAAILQGFKYLNLFKSKTNIVRVANSSFGKFVRSRAVALLVSALKKSPNEVLVVGAAGNEDSMVRSYPAAFNDAVAVAALQEDKAKSPFSNFGPWVDVAAPGGSGKEGGNVWSTVPGGSTGEKPGTSMASPIVAGVAGLVLAYDKNKSWKDLRKAIVEMADPAIYSIDINEGRNYNFYYTRLSGETIRRPLLGAGIVDASAALDGTKPTGVFGGRIARVQRGCSAVTDDSESGVQAPFWMLLMPALLAFGQAWRRKMTR
jgi:subtilisin family serine protease